ncbi:hypothetical protein EF910_31955 [Streptomyces sp. WAC07149]|uniref:hypothetical protein n=1 Tax=Streptomyces sp. WAC07149 TaxID=2487425 RepID=UPI000F7B254C|nr:hypothetical protein [Streptomyces sp. WAC07149]RST00352.1 hypothetical protein EF910_31955 [Streptomyces sp. WAC07149]
MEQHPEKMPWDEDPEVVEALTKVMSLGIGPGPYSARPGFEVPDPSSKLCIRSEVERPELPGELLR